MGKDHLLNGDSKRPAGYKQACVANALGDSLTADVMALADLSEYPELKGLKDRDLAILCLSASGMTQNFIANALGVKQPTIAGILDRIDPGRRFSLNPAAKRAFMTRFAESRAVEALASITPEKLSEAKAEGLINIADKAIGIAQKLNQSKHKEVRSGLLDHMLAQMESECEEADIEEVDDGRNTD